MRCTTIRFSSTRTIRSCIGVFSCRIHARKLYVASLFRMFDESDWMEDRSGDVFPEQRVSHLHREVPPMEGESCSVGKLQFQNVLENGVVIGAVENRYDHYVCVWSECESRSSSRTWCDWAGITTRRWVRAASPCSTSSWTCSRRRGSCSVGVWECGEEQR